MDCIVGFFKTIFHHEFIHVVVYMLPEVIYFLYGNTTNDEPTIPFKLYYDIFRMHDFPELNILYLKLL